MEEDDIELHPETTRQRQDTYSSLTDLEGIDIFYDSFQEAISKVKKIENLKYQELMQEMFIGQMVAENNADAKITSQLFVGQEAIVLRHDYEKENVGVSVMDVSLVLISILAVTALYVFFFNDRKVRRKRI